MLLSKTEEYALRAVSTLALLPEDQSPSAKTLAKISTVPLPYLSKILRQLVSAEILTAQKGPGGGFKFTRPLKKITLEEVLRAVGYVFDLKHCAFGWKACNHKKPCPLHDAYSKLKKETYHWAQSTNLLMLAKQRE